MIQTIANHVSDNIIDCVYREEDEVEDDADIDVDGYYTAIRSAPRPVQQQITEILSNSLEAIRLSEQKSPNNKSKIMFDLHLDDNDKPEKIVVEDYSENGTGIKNLKSKNILKQYNHKGDKNGFSEYGEGGSEALKQVADTILYETVNKPGVSESLLVDKDTAIENGNIKQSSIYSDAGSYIPPQGYSSGTKITLTNLYEMYTTSEQGIEFLDGTIAKKLSESIVRLKLNIEEFQLRVFKKHEIKCLYDITSSSNLKAKLREHHLSLLQHKETREKMCLVEKKGKKYTYEKKPSKRGDSYISIELKTRDEVRKSVEPKSKKGSTKQKKTFEESYNPKYDIDNYESVIPSQLILSLSTDEEHDHDKMGFAGHRRVAGDNIIKSSGNILNLDFGKFKSHRTRYGQFRGAMNYDRNWDKYLNSDKSKTISDDRPFIPSIQCVIKGLTADYFRDMKKEHGDYNAEKEADDYYNDENEETTNDQEDTNINIVQEEVTPPVDEDRNNDQQDTNINIVQEEVTIVVSEESANDKEDTNINIVQEEVTIVVSEDSANDQEDTNINIVQEEVTIVVSEDSANDQEDTNINIVQEEVTIVVSEDSANDQEDTNINIVQEEVTIVVSEDLANDQRETGANEIIEPDIVYRSESLAEYVNKLKINKALNNWISSPQHHVKLNDALENLYKVHRLIDLGVFTSIYSKLKIEEKVEIFKEHLNNKYIIDTDIVDEGSKFLRAYNSCINE
jgi:hypothetical protein